MPNPINLRLHEEPVTVVIEIGGRVRDVYVSPGSGVRTGDVLVQLDTSELLLKKQIIESKIHSTELLHTSARFELPHLYRELRQLQMQMDRLTITSPTDGKIVGLYSMYVGKTLEAGNAIAVIFRRRDALE